MGNRFDKTTTVTCPTNQLKTLYAISCPDGHFSYSYTFQTRNFFYFQVLLQPNDVMHCLLSGVVVATPSVNVIYSIISQNFLNNLLL